MDAFRDVAAACPDAPAKPPSSRIDRLKRRWVARGVVRELFPSLAPKDPEYFQMVDAAEAVGKKQG